MSENTTIDQMGEELDALKQKVEQLRQDLSETLKLLYRHGHHGMVGDAHFPEDLGGMRGRMVRAYAESEGALFSRIAAVTDDDSDGE